MFRHSTYESYLFQQNVKLEDKIKKMRTENKAAWDQLNAMSRNPQGHVWNPCSLSDGKSFEVILSNERRRNEIKDDEIEWLKIQNKNLKNMAYPSRPCDYIKDSENDLLKSDFIRAKNEIGQLKNENRELKKKLSENRMLRTLEQYQKDEREQIAKIQTLEYEIQGLKDKTPELLKKNNELETELKRYKDFVNSIMVILNEEKEG